MLETRLQWNQETEAHASEAFNDEKKTKLDFWMLDQKSYLGLCSNNEERLLSINQNQ